MRPLHWCQLTSHPHLLAGILFFVLTVGITRPLITKMDTHVTPGQQPAMAVTYLNLWTLAWNHKWILGETDSYWDANLFHPHQKTLAYSEPQFATGVLTFPIVFFGGSTVLAYNMALLGFLWGAAMATYALCWWLLGSLEEHSRNQMLTKSSNKHRWLAAVTAGIFYGFHFYLFREIGVLQLLATLFLPLTFLGIHRFFYQHRWSDALLSSIGFIGTWYTCAYYGLFLTVFVPCFAIRLGGRDLLCKKVLMKGAITLTLLFVSLMPLIYGMWSAKATMGLDRPEFIVRDLSAAFKEYLKLPHYSWLYGDILGTEPGQSLFLGAVLLCLASLGVIVIFRTKYNKIDPNIEQLQPRIHRYGKFYLFVALLAFLLSLGMALAPRPSTELGVYQFLVWLSPYNLLYQFLPGFSSIRSPYRFYVFIVLFLALLAGYGLFWLSYHARLRWRRILVPFLIVLTCLELWPIPLRLVRVPRGIEELSGIYAQVSKLPIDSVLIELPIVIGESERELEMDARSMYFSSFHGIPLVNGYSGFTPHAHFDLVTEVLPSTPQATLFGLKAFGVQYVLAHTDQLNKQEKVHLQQLETKGLNLLSREADDLLYQVDYKSIETLDTLPELATVKIYESEKSRHQVSICFYYKVDAPHCMLITPWQNQFECQIAWYRIPDLQNGDTQPIMTSQVPYRGSKLITAASSAIELQLPAPPPGEYQVVVQQRLASHVSEHTLMCQIHPSGFVTCQGDN